jgi:hypothetical protein
MQRTTRADARPARLSASALAIFALVFALVAGAGESGANSVAGSSNAPVARVSGAVQRALRETQVDKRLELLSDLGTSLSLAEIPEALTAAESLKELRERIVLKQTTLNRWAELAPAEAFAQIAKLPESQWKANTLREAAAKFARKDPERAAAAAARMNAGASRNDALALIANVWAHTNVNAALAWAEKLPDGSAKESALDAVRYVWVHSDPVAAASHVQKLPRGQTKNNLVANVAHEWAARDPAAAIEWARRLPEAMDSETALVSAAESWANQDPKAAAAFALKLTPEELRAQAGAMVASRWARQDPRQAADWAWESNHAEIRQRGLKEVLELWSGVDPAECSKWLEHLPPGPPRDQAIRDFAALVTLWAPDLAARDALLIGNEVTREDVLNESLPRWLEVDPAAATNWLNDAALPGPLKERWRKAAAGQ